MEVLQNLVDYYHENKLAHAYLIETNNLDKCYTELLEVIKAINCPKHYQKDCHECSLCNLININNLPTFIVISPDGSNIKKEQIIELKNKFNNKPIYTKENIYVIKEAEKLNAASANTMLKFLEEPESDILGFFITNSINNVISTIKSRCEILYCKYPEEESLDEYHDIALEYIKKIELEKNATILYNKNVILKTYPEKDQIQKILKEMFNIYDKLLLDNTSKTLTEKDILQREKILSNYINNLIYNVNLELFLDGLVIELSGLENENI